jgi:hypothetical protein
VKPVTSVKSTVIIRLSLLVAGAVGATAGAAFGAEDVPAGAWAWAVAAGWFTGT